MDQSQSLRSEEELCAKAQAGDRAAEEVLAVRCSHLVKSCARPYFLIGADSEDLIQEGMLGLLKAIRSFDAVRGVPFEAYARTCITSRIYSAVRSAAADKHKPLNNSESISQKSLIDDSHELSASLSVSDPALLVIHIEEQQERLQHLEDQLSPFEKRVLQLFLAGLSYQDMAEQLGKPVKSVDNAVQRIRRKAAAFQGETD
ncbi:MAG: sigma-70 family RNA polymerase sigma factor [Eubacteriales bacterium]|nr:sigma-70 family RNA polymerase sigma factor [Eubacteriales bacterium]